MDISLSDWTTIFEIAKSIATVIGIVVGGAWTYLLFVRNRLDYPRIKITMVPQEIPLPNNKRLIHTEVYIENIGQVILKSTKEPVARMPGMIPAGKIGFVKWPRLDEIDATHEK